MDDADRGAVGWTRPGRRPGEAGSDCTAEARFPLMDPMPEAWDEGEPGDRDAHALTPRLAMDIAERALDEGKLEKAAWWLAPGDGLDRMVRRIAMPSWTARLAIARARLDLARAYEARHGAGSLRDPDHRARLARRWTATRFRTDGSVAPVSSSA